MGNQIATELSNAEIILDCSINLIEIIRQDIEEYYFQILESAIEYGLSVKDFWDCEIDVFYCYENAYLSKLHNQTHLQGYYNYVALTIVLSNILRNKNDKELKYPEENYYIQYLKGLEDKEEKSIIRRGKRIQNGKGDIGLGNKESFEEIYRDRLSQCY